LIESELFGHERGSFTDAQVRRLGQFEVAHGGSLFLDEIGDLSLATQAKLLRVLQEREFTRIGGTQPVKVDVRIMAATNKNLEELLERKEFREDLYYRINVVSLYLPPLRKRREDIPSLVKHFIAKRSGDGNGSPPEVSKEALEILEKYYWPGNIRELENVVEQALVWAAGTTILPDHLPASLRTDTHSRSLRDETLSGRLSLEKAVMEFEREIILNALRQTDYVQTHASALLGISRRMLKYRMDMLGIRREDAPGSA
jgi:DNA-binding NtrC family response regulator